MRIKVFGVVIFTLFVVLILLKPGSTTEEEKWQRDMKVEAYMMHMADQAIKMDSIVHMRSKNVFEQTVEDIKDALDAVKYGGYIGKQAPDFSYQDKKGAFHSLSNFKGNWVLIDVWASWCLPCLQDVKPLNKLKEKFPNIKFLGVSIDKESFVNKWEKVLEVKQPSGIQIMTGTSSKDFQEKYLITSIPRYILINPKGEIAHMNLPRPHKAEMEAILKNL